MAQSSQSTPDVTTNIGGVPRNVNLRDYLNIRLAPFLKKAITESLDASPEFPLQWLGENLIHQSMLYEGNPDRTNIKERFVYDFEAPVARTVDDTAGDEAVQPAEPAVVTSEPPSEPAPITNGHTSSEAVPTQDAPMSNHADNQENAAQVQQEEGPRDTEMEGTS